jgi:hypothetical protein
MSDTPRTAAVNKAPRTGYDDMLNHARQLERELAAALGAIKFARSHLYAAVVQGIPSDDTIIANHIEAAYVRLKEVANELDAAMMVEDENE